MYVMYTITYIHYITNIVTFGLVCKKRLIFSIPRNLPAWTLKNQTGKLMILECVITFKISTSRSHFKITPLLCFVVQYFRCATGLTYRPLLFLLRINDLPLCINYCNFLLMWKFTNQSKMRMTCSRKEPPTSRKNWTVGRMVSCKWIDT